MFLGLGLGACKKEEVIKEIPKTEESFVMKGETFKVAEVRKKLSLILAVDENKLVFVTDSVAFRMKDSYGLMYLEPIIESIKQVKL